MTHMSESPKSGKSIESADVEESAEVDVPNSMSSVDFLRGQSLLGLLYSRSEIAELLIQFPPESVSIDQVIASEGEAAEYLFIPLQGELKVQSRSELSMNFEQGELGSGRAFNLYALLRGLPYQYTLVAKTDCDVLKVPWAQIRTRLDAGPVLNTYLLRVTESPDYKFLRRDIEDAGCSIEFRISMISAVEERKVSRQLWLASQGQAVTEASMFIRGEVIAIRHADNSKKNIAGRWNLPHRVWVNWSLAAGESASLHEFSIRSQTEIHYFVLTSSTLQFLKNRYPIDFSKWSKWVESAKSSKEADTSSAPEQTIDLDEFVNQSNRKRSMWKPFPWVQQNDQMDCGAACLAMIGQYFGGKQPIQYWRSQLSTDQAGTSVFDLCKTAERAGILTSAISAEDVEEIPQNAYPVIIVRQYHYLVLYGRRGKSFIIGDPGVGIRKVSSEWINDGFENAYVVFRPTDSFSTGKVNIENGVSFRALMMPFKREIALAFLASIFMVMLSVLPPVITQNLLDDVLATTDLDLFKYCFMALIGYTVFNAFMTWVRAFFLEFVAIRLDFLAKTAFLQRLMNLPYSFFATRHVGDFTRRLHEFQTVRSFLTEKSLSFVLSLVSLVIYLLVLFSYSTKIGLLVLVCAPVFILVSMFFTKSMISAYSEYFAAQAEEDGYISDLIRGMLAVKTNGAELSLRRIYEMFLVKSLKERYRFKLSSVALNGVITMVFELSRYALLGTAVWLAMRGELSAGQVVAISMLANEVLEPFQKMAIHWADFQESKLIISRLNDVYLTPLESRPSDSRGQKTNQLTGMIEFRDVWFRYGGEASEWTLKGVSFVISAGTKVSICGPSGSGKSTVAMLLSRVYIPNKGQILLDGKDIRDYDLGWLRERIGYVPQESHLFPGTVASNIALSGESFTEESLQAATDIADATDFVKAKPAGIDTFVPAGGHGFSGGEKQRLALARILHRNPDFLVLDEATSALDGLSEKNFLSRVDGWGTERTIVSIAHRYSTVVRSEVVILMHQGRVRSIASPDVMSRTDKLFQDMFETDLGVVRVQSTELEDRDDSDESKEHDEAA